MKYFACTALIRMEYTTSTSLFQDQISWNFPWMKISCVPQLLNQDSSLDARSISFRPPSENRENDLIPIMTPEEQDKTSELSKHWSPDSTPARNEVIMKVCMLLWEIGPNVCCYEKLDQPMAHTGASDWVSGVCLMHDTRRNQHQSIKSNNPGDKISILKRGIQNHLYHCMKLVREWISHYIFHRPLVLSTEIWTSTIKFFKWISQAFHFIALSTESLWRYLKHHNMSSTLHILSAAKCKHNRKG